MPACATKVAALSMSETVSVPEVEISDAELVSVRLRTSAESTAASLLPAMLMVTEVSVPSELSTQKVSVWVLPAWELVVGGAGGVGPGAGGIDREGAVEADGAALRHEGGGAVGAVMLSGSVMVSVPELEMSLALLVSVRLRTSAERSATSSLPRILMVTEVSVKLVPKSQLVTSNVSV